MSQLPAPIVVGLDGSSASLAALQWAAGEAAAHGAPLVAVYVSDPRSRRFAPYAAAEPAQPLVPDATDAVRQMLSESGIEGVRRVFEVGIPSQVLVRVAIGARMLVLGHADHHRQRDKEAPSRAPALGSIARACVARATCPVVIVPIPSRRLARVAVEPESRRVPIAQGAPVIGGRTIYPKRQTVWVAHT
ncbi:MAG TPA: universal stress protein [Actinocrinis sp.]|nr:universal stress protein [Actinocrinis sp.]